MKRKKSWDKPSDRRRVAILCADLHFSHRCPPCREGEPDWYECMKRYMLELEKLTKPDLVYEDRPPIICAGDVFDRWYEPPELINFCLTHLPHMYTIPGQHDLPYHQYEDIQKSAYWTLVKGGKITTLDEPMEIVSNGQPIMLHPFPYGRDLKKPIQGNDLAIDLAVVHSYLWIKDYSFPDAPAAKRLKEVGKVLQHYDAAVFGDNHKGFLSSVKDKHDSKVPVLNCGTFFRRRSDEVDYRPAVGILYNDNSIERHYLDTSKDQFTKTAKGNKTTNTDYREVVEELKKLGDSALDFVASLRRIMDDNKTDTAVRREIETALEDQDL